jgi:hypothetical protein
MMKDAVKRVSARPQIPLPSGPGHAAMEKLIVPGVLVVVVDGEPLPSAHVMMVRVPLLARSTAYIVSVAPCVSRQLPSGKVFEKLKGVAA